MSQKILNSKVLEKYIPGGHRKTKYNNFLNESFIYRFQVQGNKIFKMEDVYKSNQREPFGTKQRIFRQTQTYNITTSDNIYVALNISTMNLCADNCFVLLSLIRPFLRQSTRIRLQTGQIDADPFSSPFSPKTREDMVLRQKSNFKYIFQEQTFAKHY